MSPAGQVRHLTSIEKDAFFSLLDEYFATRGGVAALTAAKGPAGQAALGKLSSSASQFKADMGSKYLGGGHAADPPERSPSSTAANESTVDQSSRPSFGALRGAFASAQSSLASHGVPRPGGVPPRPPPLNASREPDDGDSPPPVVPRRTVPTSTSSPVNARLPAGLQSGKHFGSGRVDLTSASTAASSLFGGRSTPTAAPAAPPPPPIGGASGGKAFMPPPVRRVPSAAAPVPEPVVEGEWAEALYEYTSDDHADLHFDEGARIRIIDRTNDDWWTGELNGKEGLFPVTYVKLL